MKPISTEALIEGVLQGNRVHLSRAITLVESTLPKHRLQAEEILEACLHQTGQSIRIGITGVPGVGKSTFIESFGSLLTQNGHKVAILAIDPRSERTKGSILGDKTRMERLANDPRAFIQPTSSGGALGGVAPRTRETLLLCEAAGFDVVLVETVGVGQSETEVAQMVDFFLLLMLAGAGDELQGIKRGIMELADAIVITKADGANERNAAEARMAFKRALHFLAPKSNGWKTNVFTCSALQEHGIDPIWENIQQYQTKMQETGQWTQNRRDQARFWLYECIETQLKAQFYGQKK